MEYRVEQQPTTFDGTLYSGYIDGEYAGYVVGTERYKGCFYINDSGLVGDFRGTKAVRATVEILKGVFEDYDTVMTRVCNQKNDSIKILLNAGFHIIGTVSYQSNVAVELQKTKENA